MVNTTHISTNPRQTDGLTGRAVIAGLALSFLCGPLIVLFGAFALHSWIAGPIVWACVVALLDGYRSPHRVVGALILGLTAGALTVGGALLTAWIVLSNCNCLGG